MLVMMKAHATDEEINAVCRKIEAMGFKAHPIPGSTRTAIGITGNQEPIEAAALESLPGVGECVPVSKPYKLVGRELKEETTVIDLGDGVRVGGQELAIIAGPCAVENREQARIIAAGVSAAGARLFRGGAYKPRTSPYSFQGLAEDGLKILDEVRRDFGLKIVTEAIDVESVDLVERYADIIQVGARNMQNFSLLKRAGRSPRPVLLKRGISATLDELLMAAEYILSEGNYRVILCERGIRTFTDHTRNTLDLSVIPAVQRLSHLPIIVDPSHGTGRREKVLPLSRAAIAVGADGLIIEVHHHPEEALSDGYQSIKPLEFRQLMKEIRQIATVLGRTLAPAPEGAAGNTF
jgi:3-deoxy-7-phosphoheptulonate synthase